MDNRKTNEGQLRPLTQRLTTTQAIRRAMKETRRGMRLNQMSAMAMGRANFALQMLGRGFFGRFKWLLLGR